MATSTYRLAYRKNPLVLWWRGLDHVVLMLVGLLLVMGGIMGATASGAVSDTYGSGAYHFLYKQLFFYVLSVPLLLVASMMPQQFLERGSYLFWLCVFVAVALTLVIGKDVKGATRWIEIGGFTLQPTEFMKPAFALMSASLLAYYVKRNQVMIGFIVTGAVMAVQGVLMLLQPNFSMFLLIGMVWFLQCFYAGVPFIYLLPLMFLGGGAITVGYLALPHVRNRIDTFINPESGDLYQVNQARDAVMSGGLWGRGAGEGVVKHTLPDAHTDFIFAVMVEEFGAVFSVLVLCVFATIAYRCFMRAIHHDNLFVMIAASGLTTVFALQALINISVVLHVIPTTGMTLPFVSYGGSAVMAMAITIGLILGLTRTKQG